MWYCYYCGECSLTCPRSAEPGEYMASLRRFAIAKYEPSGLAGLLLKFPFGAASGNNFADPRRGEPGVVGPGITSMLTLNNGDLQILDSTFNRVVTIGPDGRWKGAVVRPQVKRACRIGE